MKIRVFKVHGNLSLYTGFVTYDFIKYSDFIVQIPYLVEQRVSLRVDLDVIPH